MVRRTIWRLVVAWGAAATLTGLGCIASSYRPDIQSSKAGDRILGIKAAGDMKDRSAVPLLVDRLDDEDEAVRFYAILSLERIAGTRLGYDYKSGGRERAVAIQRWRERVQSGEFRETIGSTRGKSSAGATDGAASAADAQ